MKDKAGEGRLEYVCADVSDQEKMWKVGEMIGDREGHMDACVAAAGILEQSADCLHYPAEDFRKVLDVNVSGVLFTAQAAGQQMRRFGNGGSIVLLASIAGRQVFEARSTPFHPYTMTPLHPLTVFTPHPQGHPIVQYYTSKAAVHQLTRALASELGPERIRVNSVSPGFMRTRFTKPFLDARPEFEQEWGCMNPLGRMGEPHELRGAFAWLASDSSSFCTGSEYVHLSLFGVRHLAIVLSNGSLTQRLALAASS
ncbi:hypothetical protein C8Q79DRAFT_1010290 [Trametes meyenii]|nr:hypothetical protein C8Q79DRAFT_1010290 [Trametes meyenii]